MIDESQLTKGQLRKLTALRKSLGNRIANRAFRQWMKAEEANKAGGPVASDPMARKIAEALQPLAQRGFGLYGYTVKRGRGKGPKGLIVVKNTQPSK